MPADLSDYLGHLGLDGLTPQEIAEVVAGLPGEVVDSLLAEMPPNPVELPATPADQAAELDARFSIRSHTRYISDRIAAAAEDVANGRSRFLIVETPPRVGKSTLVSMFTPLWVLRRWPDWKVGITSYDASLVTGWARQVRNLITEHPSLGIRLAPDSGAAGQWSTTEGGGVVARSLGAGLTGLGVKVLVVDDPVKDYVEAHSEVHRTRVWNWWLSVAQTRLEPPSLVIVTMTRWHESDLVGRLLSDEYEGDPGTWEEIRLPALAVDSRGGPPDLLGRLPGEPLLSPLVDETAEEAAARWEDTRRSVGPYTFASLYQQDPAPSKGAIFNIDWWRYWTPDPARADRDGEGNLKPMSDHSARTVYVNPADLARGVGVGSGRWLDSWDMAFKGTAEADYVVGQRWLSYNSYRLLIHQTRARRTFTATLQEVKAWADPNGPTPYAARVLERVVEDKANGTAVIDSLRSSIPGIVPVNPTDSKVGRARAITPYPAAGNVLLPHPSDPGNEWVRDLLEELRNFPNSANDDQCLVGSTQITTQQGPRRLDAIRPGDVVLGASGWVDVLAAGRTGRNVPLVGVAGLTGTGNHPVWVIGRGWVPLSEVGYNDLLWTHAPSLVAAPLFSPVAGAASTTRGGTSTATQSTSNVLPGYGRSAPTWAVTRRSPRGPSAACAASTGSGGTTRLSTRSSTAGSPIGATRSRPPGAIEGTTLPGGHSPRAGSGASTGRSGSTATALCPPAGRCTTSTTTPPTTTSPTSSPSPAGSTMPSTPRRSGARGAAGVGPSWPIWPTSDRWLPSGTVPRKAGRGTGSTRSTPSPAYGDVFNLTTSDGTYFADGVLVHNCDAMSQALARLRDRGGISTSVPSGRMIDRTLPASPLRHYSPTSSRGRSIRR